MDSPKLERLTNQWLLVDTSVWIRISKYGEAIQKPLLDIAQKYSCTLTVHDLIIQEFMSYTIKQDAYTSRLGLIKSFASLPIQQDIKELAVYITRIYAINKISSPSVTDSISAAFLRKYAGKLYLLTNDIKDFPIAVFNPFEIWPFDGGQGNELFAFYEYDQGRFRKQERQLARAALNS